jgi:hypothetical protein
MVYDAASNIVKRIPQHYDHFDADTRGWFMLGIYIYIFYFFFFFLGILILFTLLDPIGRKENFINLTSFSIDTNTLPKGWLFTRRLGSVITPPQSNSANEGGSQVQRDDSGKLRISYHILASTL